MTFEYYNNNKMNWTYFPLSLTEKKNNNINSNENICIAHRIGILLPRSYARSNLIHLRILFVLVSPTIIINTNKKKCKENERFFSFYLICACASFIFYAQSTIININNMAIADCWPVGISNLEKVEFIIIEQNGN